MIDLAEQLPKEQTSLQKYQAAWWRENVATLAQNSARIYERYTRTFLEHFPDYTEPGDFSRADVVQYRAVRRKKGVSANTVNQEIAAVRRFWNWLIRNGNAEWNPADNVRCLPEQRKERMSLTEDEQRTILAAALKPNERLLVSLALTTALRAASLAQLERRMFDFEHGMLITPPGIMKGRNEARFAISSADLEYVKGLPEGIIWGKVIRGKGLTRTWNRVLKRVGIPLRGLHVARRTVATTLIRNRVDLKRVQKLLGHKNVLTTMRYLNNTTDEDMKEAASVLPLMEAQ